MAECIHGLAVSLCDVCNPKATPEPTRRVNVARVARPASPRTTDTSRSPRVSSSRKSISASAQRVYHVTHLRNLEAILASGALSADAAPIVDVSTDLARELRATAVVAPDLSVAAHVAFFLSPDATLWSELRSGAEDEIRWSGAARRATPADFVVLVTTIGDLGPDVVVTDGDAAVTYTRFVTGGGVQRAVERAYDNDDVRVVAEALAPGAVPLGAIQLIGVANDPVREWVREMVSHTGSGAAPKVAVYPPWFASF